MFYAIIIFNNNRTGEEDHVDNYTFTTMEMMESLVRPEPADFVYGPVPLMRLLSRAVYADTRRHLESWMG